MSSQTIPILVIYKDGKTFHQGTIPLSDFNDSTKWDLSPVTKSLGLPLKARGLANDLTAASESDKHDYINSFFTNYDPYSPGFGQLLRAPFVGDQVILARCDGLPLDGTIVNAIHGHITALTCDGKKCGSVNACNCPKDDERAKKAIVHACSKKVFSDFLARALGMMAAIPGASAIKNPFAEDADKSGAVPFCAGCGMARKEGGSELMKCAKCKEASYCGKKCQKGEWAEHKKECKKGSKKGGA